MDPMLPFIEVSHLPSSSSFYSAITQPLGLRYVSVSDFTSTGQPTFPSVIYGLATSPPTPVFELRQVRPTPSRPLKLSRIIFSAPSPTAVRQFQASVRRSKNTDGRAALVGDETLLLQFPEPSEAVGSVIGAGRGSYSVNAAETDLDGNMMEVVYMPPPGYPEGYIGSTVRKTQSDQGEVSRILSWNYDVIADSALNMSLAPLAPASPSLVSPRRPGRFPDDDMAPIIRRSITSTTTTVVEPLDSMVSPRQNSSGLLSTGTVVGALLGVAAAGAAIGAGVTYGAMKNERLRNEFETPPFQRRSTFPEPYPDAHSRYSEYGPPRKDYHSVADRRPPPTSLTRYHHSQGPQDADNLYDDTRSRHSSRFKPSGAPSIRTRSEASSSRKPLLLTEAEHRSYTSSKASAKTSELEDMVAADYRSHASSRYTSSRSKYAPSIRRSNTFDVADGDTYVSARSHKTASTLRAPPQPTELMSRPVSKAASRASAVPRRADSYASAREALPSGSRTTSRISARNLPSLPASHIGSSYVSARHVPLPQSGVGTSHAGWEREDDLDSIAPSDSISCVGSRGSARLYH